MRRLALAVAVVAALSATVVPVAVHSAFADGIGGGEGDTPPPSNPRPDGSFDGYAEVLWAHRGGRNQADGGSGGGYVDPTCGWTKLADPPRTIGGATFDAWVKACGVPGNEGVIPFWVQRVTVADELVHAEAEARGKIPTPSTEFLDLEPGFGWTYVTKPTPYRVTNLAPISVTATASAGPVSVSVTVTAAPSWVRFGPGEPKGHWVGCSTQGAQAPLSLDWEHPGECTYTYVDSSAIAENGRTFETTTEVDWDLSWTSGAGGGVLAPFMSTSTASLAVAEIHALVTCVGPLPEQGGC